MLEPNWMFWMLGDMLVGRRGGGGGILGMVLSSGSALPFVRGLSHLIVGF